VTCIYALYSKYDAPSPSAPLHFISPVKYLLTQTQLMSMCRDIPKFRVPIFGVLEECNECQEEARLVNEEIITR